MNATKKKAYLKFARTGFAIKGVVYILLGMLAVTAAAGPAGKTAGRIGVLKWIDHQPFGTVLLTLIIAGLTGYVALRLMQAIKDTNNKGKDWYGLGRRTGYLLSAIIYIIFIIAGFYLLFPHSGVWKSKEANYVEMILHLPAGNIAVGITGVITGGYGISQMLRGFKRSFKKYLRYGNLSRSRRILLNSVGVLGFIARGIILCLIGYFVIKAAFEVYKGHGRFTSQAFSFLSSYLGSFIMGLIAAGLVLYGGFMFVKAKYYNVTTE